MTIAISNLVQEISTDVGSGSLALTPILGFRTFASAIGNSIPCYYYIIDNTNGAWEYGVGIALDGSLVRQDVFESSNANELVNFLPGTKTVINDLPAQYMRTMVGSIIEGGADSAVLFLTTDGSGNPILAKSSSFTYNKNSLELSVPTVLSSQVSSPIGGAINLDNGVWYDGTGNEIQLPDKSGVFAVTSDISAALVDYLLSSTAASTYASISDVVAALATKYDSANPSGYITNSALTGYLLSTTAAATYATLSNLASGLAGKEPTITGSGNVGDYYGGDKAFHILNKAAVGLSNVDNTSDATKPVSSAQAAAIGLKYDAANPAGYITAAALTGYLLSSTAASTYATITSVTAVSTALAALTTVVGTKLPATNVGVQFSLGVTIDGQGGTPLPGNYKYIVPEYDCTILAWGVTADVASSSIQFDLRRSGTTIIGTGNKPVLSVAQSANASVSGWTSVDLTAWERIRVAIDSASTLTWASLKLTVVRR